MKDFRRILKYAPRSDLADADGKTAIEIMSRKQDPAFRKMAEELGGDSAR